MWGCSLETAPTSPSFIYQIRYQGQMFWLGWSGVQVCSGAFYCILDFLWLFQKGRPLPRPESYSHPTLGSELSQETHVLTKQETLLDRIAGQRARGWGNPGSLLCYVTQSLGLYGDRINLWVVSRQSFWLRVFPGGSFIAQPRWIPLRRW